MALVLFFDGDCGFCSKSVRRVYQFDSRGMIHFAPLQGKLSKELGLQKYAEKGGGSMVILRESDGIMFIKGDALIALGKALGGIWAALSVAFSLVPKQVRDWAYERVAKNRYRIAGEVNACEMPEEGLRKRMRD
jgi:predicted DCC family thiol-disulfide oxidoreductase YuxK